MSWKHQQRRPRSGRSRGRSKGQQPQKSKIPAGDPPPQKDPMESVEQLSDLRRDHCTLAFHVQYNPCPKRKRKRNCVENPNCLFGLGEEDEGVWSGKPDLGDDPENEAREPGTFAGIQNLGATCYMGSLLQCLYMNRNFRQGVYDWTEHGKDGNAVCRNLQLLFTELQVSSRNVASPLELSQSLNVPPTVQQDAQEFNKLFISYLEERFATSEQDSVKHLMKQFYGQCVYVTTCEACHSVSESGDTAFHELELNIRGMDSLEKCLQNFFKEELLTDSNKYFCDKCNSLQNATRSISILEFPEVLNIQLLRFVYDKKDEVKKKLTATVSFPLELNMADNYPASPEKERKQPALHTYLLTAVLLHIGTSANGGHYIAHIRDELNDEWWEFDDHSVIPLDKEMIGVQSAQHKAKKRKGQEKEAGRAYSSNAYMLIYTQKGRDVTEKPLPPKTPIAFIKQRNEEFAQRREKYFKDHAEEMKRIEARRKEYESISHALGAKQNADKYFWIATEWLHDWVIGKPEQGEINNKDICCDHGKLSPIFIPKMKRLSLDGWNFLFKRYHGGPVLSEQDYCPECTLAYCKEQAQERKAERKKIHVINQIASGNTPKDGYWISNEWLNTWKRKNTDDLSHNINADITCEHGNLQAKQSGRKIVSVEIWSYLRSQYGEGQEFPSSFEGCRICRDDSTKREEERQIRTKVRGEEKKELTRIQKLNNPQHTLAVGTYFLVPCEWIDEWRAYITDVDVDEPPQPIDNSVFLCEHQGLTIDPSIQQHTDTQSANRVCFLPENLWQLFRNQYGGEIEICYNVGKSEVILEPSICETCLKERQLQEEVERYSFTDGTVTVSTADRKAKGTRSSRRRGAKSENIKVSSSDNIYHLRLKIYEAMGIAPGEQRLFLGDVELKNPLHTLEQYKIGQGDTIHLEQQELAPDQFDAMMCSSGGKETGFAGTSLHSGGRQPAANGQAAEQNGTTDSGTDEWICGQCTFSNSQGNIMCEMCEAPKPQ